MAQDGNNVRRCGQIGDGEDDELSMVDVLNEQARLQADANAVLGGSDEKNCTYPQGYLKRQALYACATCTPEGNAGICLACSYTCHEGHDVHELYTKRYFTCDCGNEKFGGKDCKLYTERKGLNARNRYNQNFRGLYCTCARPYPDPDDTVEDEMIQCIMCEDWYHGRHLKAPVPDSDDFQEMTCPCCMSKYSFLWAYHISAPVVSVKQVDSSGATEDLDIGTNTETEPQGSNVIEDRSLTHESEEHTGLKPADSASKDDDEEQQQPLPTASRTSDETESTSASVKRESPGAQEAQGPLPKKARLEEEKPKTQSENDKEVKEEEGKEQDHGECLLKSLQKRVVDHPDCAAFWPEGWRAKLCRCTECMEMYKDREIEFLIDDADTVHAYEAKGQESESNLSEEVSEASALASMNRVQQIEVIRGFEDLKTELNRFLHDFARDGKVVTETDVREFFQRMDQRRRERMHIPQHNCR